MLLWTHLGQAWMVVTCWSYGETFLSAIWLRVSWLRAQLVLVPICQGSTWPSCRNRWFQRIFPCWPSHNDAVKRPSVIRGLTKVSKPHPGLDGIFTCPLFSYHCPITKLLYFLLFIFFIFFFPDLKKKNFFPQAHKMVKCLPQSLMT